MSQEKDYIYSTLCTDRDSEQDTLIDEEQGFERRSIARTKSISTSNLSICFIIICVCVLLAVLMVAALSWHDRIIIIQTSGDLAINVNPSSKSLPQSTNDLSAQTRHPQSINDYSTKALPHESVNDHPITAAPLQPTNNLPVTSNSPYDRIFNRWRGYCESNNQVMARKDGFGIDGVPRRIWTLNDQTFNYIDRSKNPTIKHCETPAQLLDSMKYGTRVDLQHLHKFIQAAPNTTSQTVNQYIDESIDAIYNQSASEAQGEMHSSIFIPSKCTIDYRDSDSTCSILSKYSHFSVVGDSMSRHFVQSLFVVLTEDFRMGALPRLSPKSELYDSCQCDGMYSEHEVCRDFASDHIFHSRDLRSYGVCHNAIDATHRPTEFNHHPHPSQYTSNFKYLCSDDPRPRFIHLQGIWHYQGGVSVDQIPMQVIDRLIDPVMSTLKDASESCHRPFTYHVLYTAGHAQARALDANYPHQARERMAINNAALKEHIENKWNHKFIDFWNLTRDAPSSDGAHHITEVNLLKVQYVLNYMDMITTAS